MDADMIYCIAILIATFLFVYKLSKNRRKNAKKSPPLPPSPPALPIIGHLHRLKNPYHRSLQSLSASYGPIVHLRLGSRQLLVVSSPEAAEECFTKSNDVVFANRPDFLGGEVLAYSYTSLVWAPYGDHWRNLRRLTTLEVFSSNKIQKFSRIRVEEVRSLAREIARSSKEDPSGDGSVKVHLNRALLQLTRNVVMRMVNRKRWVSTPVDELFLSVPFMTLYDFFPVLRRVGYKVLQRKMVSTARKRDRILQGLIDEVRTKGCEGEEEENKTTTTVVEELLALQRTEPDYYTDDVLKGILLVLFIAGTDTSARTMEWAMSLLLNHPAVFQRARDEIDAHMSHENRLVDDSDLSSLTYLRSIINETLRLFPVAPLLLPHFSSSNITIGGYHVPRGTVLFVNAWAIQRDPKVWEDPLKFRPERFMNLKHIEGERDGFRFIPFGAGRRACPGSNLAMRTMSLTLATLIHCFDWERVGDGELINLKEETGGAVVMPKSEPLRVIFKTRSCMAGVLSQV